LAVRFEIPEFGDDLEAVVDGVAPSAALAEWLRVFEAGGDDVIAVAGPAVADDDQRRRSEQMMVWALALRR